jgi:hypothetical protein
MIEICVKRIEVDLKYVPKEWASKIMLDELESAVGKAIVEGGTEIGVKDFVTSLTHWFTLKDVPLEAKQDAHKALLGVSIYGQMVMTRSLVSLEQEAF